MNNSKDTKFKFRENQKKAWDIAQALLESQEIYEGVVKQWNRGGLVIDFYGLKGFVPASEIGGFLQRVEEESFESRLKKMVGQTLPLKVKEVDRNHNNVVLSARAAEEEWRQRRREHLLTTLKEGDVVEGVISNFANFGVFVDLGGYNGLIRLSELTEEHFNHPGEIVKIGERVSVYVLAVNQKEGRVALSLKKLKRQSWDQFAEKYSIGQLVKGQIVDLVAFGAFAQIKEGIKGLIHISELSVQPISQPIEVVKVGDKVLLRIISLDVSRKRLGLSLRQVDVFDRVQWEREYWETLTEVEKADESHLEAEFGRGELEVTSQVQNVLVQPADQQLETSAQTVSISEQVVRKMEEQLVFDNLIHLSPLLQIDINSYPSELPTHLGINLTQLSEQLAAELYQKASDKKLSWQDRAKLALQATKLLHEHHYNLSNRQMREFICAYCRLQADGYFAGVEYDAARTYYRELLSLLHHKGAIEEGLIANLILKFLKTYTHDRRSLMQASDLRTFFVMAAAPNETEPMDSVALGITNLAAINLNYVKQVLERNNLQTETKPNFFEKLSEALRRVLNRNDQEVNEETELITLLQKAVSVKNQLSKQLEELLSNSIANSYELNKIHMLESDFVDLLAINPVALYPTDWTLLEQAEQIRKNLMRYIAQERFMDKETYYKEIIKQIQLLRQRIQQTPTQYGKTLIYELQSVWKITLSVEFYLEAISTRSEYLDKLGRLEETFDRLEKFKEKVYDPDDRKSIDYLYSIYRKLMKFNNLESARERIFAYDEVRQELELARELVLTKRTYLGVQYFLSILSKWRKILENDYQSFLAQAVREQKGAVRKWEPTEEELLKAYYEKRSDLELAAYLGRTEAAIAAKMRQMSLKRKSTSQEEEQKELWQNPYIVGPPVKNKEMFFGRQDIFDYIKANLIGTYQHNTIVLHGRRRTGKSSILYQIERRNILEPCIPVFIDTQGLGRLTMSLLFFKMSTQISRTLYKHGIKVLLPGESEFKADPFWRFSQFLDDVSIATGQKLILMIDEFEKIQDEIRHGRLDVDLYDNFRHLIQHREDVGFILAGTMRMKEIVQDYTSPFFNSSLLQRVSFLRENEAIQLIRKPIEQLIQYEGETVQRILALTAGHPYFIQLTCQTLVNHLSYRKRSIVQPEDVDHVLGDVISTGEGQFIFDWDSDTTALERLILSWLAEQIEIEAGMCSASDTEHAFSRLRTQPIFKDTIILDALDDLKEKEFLNLRQSQVSFKVDLYRRWIKQNKDLNRVCKEEHVDQSLLK